MDDEHTCAICDGPLPPRSGGSTARVICDKAECKSVSSAYGARRSRIQASKNRKSRTYYKCSSCPPRVKPKPVTEEYFDVAERNPDGSVARFRTQCKVCRRRAARKQYKANVERRRQQQRETNDRRRADPVRMAAFRAYHREYKRKQREKNPEAARERNRQYRARVKADPVRLRAQREQARMAYRLRKERAGLSVTPAVMPAPALVKSHKGRHVQFPTLPAGPLVRAIYGRVAELEAGFNTVGMIRDERLSQRAGVLEDVGVTERTLYRWEHEGGVVQFDVADKALGGLGMLWFEVWEYGTPGYERARFAFEGDLELAA